jgi:hypothetical protein
VPYFIEAQGDKHCVRKGTEKEPGAVVKCHATRGEAMGHMRALYANVEDADKASKAEVSPVIGSMLHGSGGILNPMRDGDNGDAKTPTCICPECKYESKKIGSVACEDRLCPKCGSRMQAKENSMEDKEEISKATWDSAYVSKLPNSAFLYVEPGSEGETPKGKRHLPYKDASGKVDLPHLRNAISRLGQSATGTGESSWLTADLRKRLMTKAQGILKKHGGGSDGKEDDKALSDIALVQSDNQAVDGSMPSGKFTVYKSGDTWRWLAISNVSLRDKEGETITKKAYSDAIAYAREHGAGELDLVHVNGTDVGDCDLQHVLSGQLLEGGPWHSTKRAVLARESIQSDPDYWGVSIKFEFDPEQFDSGVYHGGIRILKRSILPRHMAASYGTAIAVTGGEQMKAIDEETKDALGKLGMSEEEIATLAEKQVVEQVNVKTKEEDVDLEPKLAPELPEPVPTISIPQKANFFQSLKDTVSKFTDDWFTTDVESTEPETAVPAVVEQPVAEKEVEPEVEKEIEAVEGNTETETDSAKAVMEVFGEAVAKSVREAMAPLQEIIAQQQEKMLAMEKRLLETEKDVETKVNERLESLPPIVKVQTSHLQASETDGGAIGLNIAQKQEVQTYVSKLMGDIGTEVAKKVSHQVATGKFEI